MKIVYILSSDKTDTYLEQLSLSIYSLREKNPDTFVEVVVDKETLEELEGERRVLLGSTNQVVAFETPHGLNKMQKSRWLKTNLRNLIDGDFLFIDCDTIICGELPLEQLQNFDICAVKDLHVPLKENVHKKEIIAQANKIDWIIKDDSIYHNSGVIWVRDCKMTKEFYKRWHEEWENSVTKGLSIDQPSFCKVNEEMGNIIKPMPDKWNCQISENGLRYLCDSVIIHYFASRPPRCKKPYLFNDKSIYNRIKEKGIDEHIVHLMKAPKNAFDSKILLLSDCDVDIYNTDLCKNLYGIYYYYPKVFNFLSNFLCSFISIRRKIRELLP